MSSILRINQVTSRTGINTLDFTGNGFSYITDVGFGTTNPTSKLHVEGNILVSGTGIVTATSFVGDGSGLTGVASTDNINTDTTATFNGNVSIADSIIHTGDTDTSIRFPSDNTFTVETAGSERLRVSSDGAILVSSDGGDADGANITLKHVNNNTTDVISSLIFSNNVGEAARIQAETSGGNTNGLITFHTDNAGTSAERLRIDSAGDVGIGTDDTSNKLTIVNDHQGFVDDSAQPQATLLIKHGTTGSDRRWIGIGASTDGAWIQSSSPGGSGLAAPLSINPGGGNVGIGTIDPASILHLQGSAPRITLTDTAGTDDIGKIFSTSGALFLQQRDGTGHGEIIFRTENSSTAVERLRITSSGNVGIGTDSVDRRLHVQSGANTDDGVIRIESANSNVMDIGTDTTGHFLNCVNTDPFRIKFAGTERVRINSDGDVLPGTDNSQDLGSSSLRWANIFSADLQLSNEGSSNDVDGTWGQYTIQEGENDLFLLNRRNGKTYKFVLEEVN